MDFLTEPARQRDPRFERALPDGEAAAPPPEAIGSRRAVDRGFDQGPPQPRRAAPGDAAVPDAPRAGVHARHQPRVAGELRRGGKTPDVADLRADRQREDGTNAPQLLQRD